MNAYNDKKIIDSWKKNATPWINAIQENQIESRVQITNQAIIDTIIATSAKTVLDLGCGEGWLIRKLSSYGIKASGLEVIPALAHEAQKQCDSKIYSLAYEDISQTTVTKKFDAIVCNFSLLGKESVDYLFEIVPNLLNPRGSTSDGGHFIIQTLHPSSYCGPEPYTNGWRKGSWQGFNSTFCDPAPWYFRTIESWIQLFNKYGYTLTLFQEPVHPTTSKVASLILAGQIAH